MSDYAKKLIAQAVKDQSTFLDLGMCGLTAISPEIVDLAPFMTHLNLSRFYLNEDNQFKVSENKLDNNKFNNSTSFHWLKKLPNLKSLELYDCNLGDEEIAEIINLHQLTSLDISYNQIDDKGAESLTQFKQLTFLDISGNQIGDKGAESIIKLIKLTSLNISDNQIGEKGAESIAQLKQLTSLSISRNQIGDKGAECIAKLKWLTSLSISGNQIGDKGAETIAELKQLTYLNISSNQIGNKGAESIANLKQLNSLSISENQIGDKGAESIAQLKQLTSLNISRNQIGDKGAESIAKLKQLTSLSISGNQIGNKGVESIAKLKQLTSLKIFSNQISDVTPINGLTNLKFIDISKNNIKDLAPLLPFNLKFVWDDNMFRLEKHEILIIDNNDLVHPPLETAKQGDAAIRRYFEKVKVEGIEYIREAKLILVGEGNAGKTSLQKRLRNKKATLPQSDKRTRGIQLKDLSLSKKKINKGIAHIWDFGGQAVYLPVHRFFITENAVFILLASTRQTDHNFDYWIPTIYQFGGKSPIIIGQTCHDGNKAAWPDINSYVGNPNFNIVKTNESPFIELNLPKKNKGLKAIKKMAIDQITNLPHFGKGVPASWAKVRIELISIAKDTACLHFEAFKSICQKVQAESFKELEDVADCCQFLHDIGVVLWYAQTDELKDWVILQPEWAMNAVYRIIDDQKIQEQNGTIKSKDFTQVWGGKTYKGKENILKKMLETFKIAFPKKHTKGDFILPARLPAIAEEKKWKEDKPYLRLTYTFPFMPRGLVNQLSADLSRYIVKGKEVWNNAVNLEVDRGTGICQVVEDIYNRKLSIKSHGNDARGINVLVMNTLKDIIDGYRKVTFNIKVNCPCPTCDELSNPTLFEYEKLLEWSSKDPSRTVTCNESNEHISISKLLFDAGLKRRSQFSLFETDFSDKPYAKVQTTTITLFLASSSELADERKEFELFIRKENKRLIKQGLYLDLEIWEDFVDAMSQTRLQDEYNKVIKNSSIFISLFWTKVGQFSAEEFEVAFGQFKATGKPLVYTYFKNSEISIDQLNADDLKSKEIFQKKLRSLGHFESNYSGINDLKYQFKMQLDKILQSFLE